MVKVFAGGPSRAVKACWMLNEVGVRYTTVNVFNNPAARAELLAVHPIGRVPVLLDGDFVLPESHAILSYLGDKYPEKNLIPRAGTYDRARYDRWLNFILGDLEQPLYRIVKHRALYAENQRSNADIALAKDEFRKMALLLEKQITEHLVGDQFSAADIAMAYTLNWANWDRLLEGCPTLHAYMQRHTSRETAPAELGCAPPL